MIEEDKCGLFVSINGTWADENIDFHYVDRKEYKDALKHCESIYDYLEETPWEIWQDLPITEKNQSKVKELANFMENFIKKNGMKNSYEDIPDECPETTVRNFKLKTFWGDIECIHGHEVYIMNLKKDLMGVCETCKTCIHLGRGLASTWKFENEETWQKNWEKIKDYELVE